ncbi:MAG: pilus assembly protein CpaC [Planctomycetota bacterium]|jgi:pilus assembly protein CpaC
MSIRLDDWIKVAAGSSADFGTSPQANRPVTARRVGQVFRQWQMWALQHPRKNRMLTSGLFVIVLSSLAVAAWKTTPEPKVSGLLLAVSELGAEPELAPDPARTYISPGSGVLQGEAISVRVNTHKRIQLDHDLERVAIGSPDILDVTTLNSRELLALGMKPGQTSIIVWYANGDIEQLDVTVTSDLSLLERTLSAIHPSLRVEKAPGREVLVLTGRVPRAIFSRRAEDVVTAWVQGGSPENELLVGKAAADVEHAQSSAGVGGNRRSKGSVINLVQVEGLPEYGQAIPAEEQILEVIKTIGGDKVTVRRIQKGAHPNDSSDILVLEGEVHDQVILSRVLSLAYKIFVGNVEGPDVTLTDGVTGTTRVFDGTQLAIGDDIKVIADEAGALYSTGADSQQSQNLLNAFGQGGAGAGGGQSGLTGGSLDNHVDANIGRASAIELAGGRILSFINVADLPQVRIDIRVYEVNRTKLLSYKSDLGVITSDFTQGGLNPAGAASTLQGPSAARVGAGGEDIQNVFGFLQGTLTNQLQLSGSNWAIDSLFSFLEQQDVARSMANPTLSVLSGETALFEVGGRVPIDQSFGTQVGIQGVFNSTTFIEFGVKLAVRPLVGEEDYITIDFAPEIITPDAVLTQALVEATGSNPTTFAFESRLLKTSSRLLDGQTMLVGGLQQTQRADQDDNSPWLSDIPLLGLLFQGFDYSDDDLEVVIMIRPTIVRDPLPDAAMWIYPDTMELIEGVLPERPPVELEEKSEFSDDEGQGSGEFQNQSTDSTTTGAAQ